MASFIMKQMMGSQLDKVKGTFEMIIALCLSLREGVSKKGRDEN